MAAQFNIHVSAERVVQFVMEVEEQAEQRKFDQTDLVLMAGVFLHLATKDGPYERAILQMHTEKREAVADEYLDAMRNGGLTAVLDLLRAIDRGNPEKHFESYVHAHVAGSGHSHDESVAAYVEYVSGKLNP